MIHFEINSEKKYVFVAICSQGGFSLEGCVDIIELDDINQDTIEDNGLGEFEVNGVHYWWAKDDDDKESVESFIEGLKKAEIGQVYESADYGNFCILYVAKAPSRED